jgi:histone H3/H4
MSEEKKSLVVKSSVRDLLGEMRVSEDFWDKLNEVVEKEVKNAIERAKANGRKTVRGCDL